ncbi:hypothetical protein A3766_21200, partial [Oleiphilus sp. HI0132]
HIIIIGSGHSAITLVRELRAHGKALKISLLTQDSGDLYYKPNLSKAISMNKAPLDLIMKKREVLEQEHDVKIIHQVQVEAIETDQRCVRYRDSNSAVNELIFDELVLATGASPMNLELTDSPRCVSVNNLAEYEMFRAELQKLDKSTSRIAIIGAGFVGIEFASDLCNNGFQVDVIDTASWPLSRSVPEQLGEHIMNAFPKEQVQWHMEQKVGDVQDDGDQLLLELDTGTVIRADLILSAVGLLPRVDLAKQANIEINRGIMTDEFLRTSHPNIYAIGDCAETLGAVRSFIAPATASAKCLAKTLCGEPAALVLPPQAVAVKLAYSPLVICPSYESKGEWRVEGEGNSYAARYTTQSNISGFALLGECIAQKGSFIKEIELTG